ncbi:serine/threonine-protein phosphatase 4 regulatory subunit 3-like protein isoform X4, partial [Tanacetum coccineum]
MGGDGNVMQNGFLKYELPQFLTIYFGSFLSNCIVFTTYQGELFLSPTSNPNPNPNPNPKPIDKPNGPLVEATEFCLPKFNGYFDSLVYRLNGEGKWDDQGTGHVTIDYLEIRHNSRSEDLGLFVVDEEDNETLLVHRISSEDIYRKQEDTIISWRDSEFSSELALSFQETTGCSYIWDHICNVQRNIQFNTIS